MPALRRAHQWMSRQFMVSVASGVLDVNHAMLQLMMPSRELCHQPRSPPCWNPPASVGLTGSDLMGRQLPHGSQAACLSGTFPARTHSPCPAWPRAWRKHELLQDRPRWEREASMRSLPVLIISFRWWWRPLGPLALKPWTCSQRLPGGSAQPHKRSGHGPSSSSRCP